ncbi:hypothetical protein LOTGIDRAFT_171503 [Lottia gigantea]|uniref:Uncharacterized protein n=1 Tax=Lottia gigantea TaxID=225164 RepID=V4BBI6_LOTGI|nr:hypothetical protein LOTGIDRAFT_171503 [Lottia gigantea]ESP03412.1 hypothetical protein LOTGIDRAFT_171503 [Lottia gigantea]
MSHWLLIPILAADKPKLFRFLNLNTCSRDNQESYPVNGFVEIQIALFKNLKWYRYLKGIMIPNEHLHSHWGRRLLSTVTENIQNGGDNVPVAVLLGIVLTLTLVVLVALCACGEKDDDAKLQRMKKKSSSGNIKGSVSQDDQLDVQIRSKSNGNVESNGVTVVDLNGAQNNTQHSRQSQASTTSSQMRPTSLRELPELPPNSTGVLPDNHPPSRSSQISNDDYDHLGRVKNPPSQSENYDHIDLESPAQISEASASDQISESHYAQVNDRNYEVCNSTSSVPFKRSGEEPPYNKIHDNSPSNGEESPYNQVKDKQQYNLVSARTNLFAHGTNRFTDSSDPPYNTVHDDPYNQVKDDDTSDPYNQITDPYSMPSEMGAVGGVSESHYELEPEDPYTIVDNEEEHDLRVTVLNMDRSSACSNSSRPFRLSGSVSISGELLPLINAGFGATKEAEESTENDYAVVNKERNPSTTSASEKEEVVSSTVVPPEPPRAYGAEEVHGLGPQNSASTPRLPETSPADLSLTGIASTSQNRPIREYSKVSARESLASMSARHALNPYEVVVDNENTYATVDGGSGYGVVVSAPAPSTSPVASASSSRHGNQPSRVDVQPMDTYTEIGASGGAVNNVPSAPVPPSLDSLHLMKKHERTRHLATPEDTSLEESNTNSHTSPNKRSSFSPTTALPGIPKAMSSSVHENDIILEPKYQSVKDSIEDLESENDPNYESVDEAKARFPSTITKRQHHYEEVSPTTSQPTSPNNIRTRVLNRHTYEDIEDVKEEQKHLQKSQNNNKKGPKS